MPSKKRQSPKNLADLAKDVKRVIEDLNRKAWLEQACSYPEDIYKPLIEGAAYLLLFVKVIEEKQMTEMIKLLDED